MEFWPLKTIYRRLNFLPIGDIEERKVGIVPTYYNFILYFPPIGILERSKRKNKRNLGLTSGQNFWINT